MGPVVSLRPSIWSTRRRELQTDGCALVVARSIEGQPVALRVPGRPLRAIADVVRAEELSRISHEAWRASLEAAGCS